VSKVDASKFDDAYFKASDKAEKKKKKKGESEFFEGEAEKAKELPGESLEGCCGSTDRSSLE
jgi:large subunit ribosomal protein L6e